jgi:hypothetical protein
MRALVVFAVGVTSFAGSYAPGGQPAPLETLLQRSATYLAAYQNKLATVTAEEQYKSNGARGTVRVANFAANILLVAADGSWLEFRDVFEVGGRPVRGHEDRFAALLGAPDDVLGKAQLIADESARRNIGPPRNFNVPTMALTYLMRANQPRSTFRLMESSKGAAVVAFEETARPPLIHSAFGVTLTSGRFWIDVDTGAVTKTELVVKLPESADVKRDKSVSGTTTVDYEQDEALKFLVPHEMTESYDLPAQLIAHAAYSHYKSFGVVVTSSRGRGGR